jgi:predicted GNAT family acetyltransferase
VRRIELVREGQTAVLDYTIDAETLSIWHVETPTALRGKGIGGELVEQARALATEQSLQIKPICPFAKHYLSKAPHKRDSFDKDGLGS